MKHRVLSIAILAAFLTICFCGCGNGSDVQPSDQSTLEVQEEVQPAAPISATPEKPTPTQASSIEEVVSSPEPPPDDWVWPVEDSNASLSVW